MISEVGVTPSSSFGAQWAGGGIDPGGVMTEVSIRIKTATERAIDEINALESRAKDSLELEKSWPMMEQLLEKYLDTVLFEDLIHLLIDITQFCPQTKLSMRIISHLCSNFRLDLEHPLRAVYVLISHVAGPTFLEIMRRTRLPIITKERSNWSFLDEDKDSSGVSQWLNLHVCAALNSPTFRYVTPQSWVDIALFNVCRRQTFLPFLMQTFSYTFDITKFQAVLKRLSERLSHSTLGEVKKELLKVHDIASCREVLAAAPLFFYLRAMYFPNRIFRNLMDDAQKFGVRFTYMDAFSRACKNG